MILAAGHAGHVLLDAAALHFLDLLDHVKVHAVGIVDIAVGVAHGDDLAAQLGDLLVGVDGHVATAADDHGRALDGLAVGLKHVLDKVAQAVAGGLGAGQAAAVGEALAGEHALVETGQALVLAVEEADFPRAGADIAGGHVGILADVAVELGHEALAEGHDLTVALALGVEVAAALAAADGQAGEAVLEHLLKAQELEDGQVHAGMQAQAALVGADGAVVLHAVAAVDLRAALVVHPGHAEHDDPLRLHETVQQARLFIFRVLVEDGREALQNFGSRLKKFALMGVALPEALKHAGGVSIHRQNPFLNISNLTVGFAKLHRSRNDLCIIAQICGQKKQILQDEGPEIAFVLYCLMRATGAPCRPPPGRRAKRRPRARRRRPGGRCR